MQEEKIISIDFLFSKINLKVFHHGVFLSLNQSFQKIINFGTNKFLL